MSRRSIILALAAATLTAGCGSDEPPAHDKDTQEIVDNLLAAGFPASDITVVDGVVYEGRDAMVSLTASREMLQVNPSAGHKEQYRSNNVVGWNVRKICIDGHRFDTRYTYSVALNNAIANYNGLGLSFSMQRTGEPPAGQLPPGCDALITAMFLDGTGGGGPDENTVLGKSSYPENGLPYSQIQISDVAEVYGLGVTTWVITHELGHTIGMRHSDFYNTEISCGPYPEVKNEGGGTHGANWIPGTPSFATVGGSIMNACPRLTGSRESGFFTIADIFAIISLYGDVQFEIFGCCTNAAPAVASWGPGRLDLFVRGYDYALWHRSIENGVVGAWESLGGYLTSAPTAVSWGYGRLDVFALSGESLYHQYFDAGWWSGWEWLGGSLISAPAAASWGPGRLDVFAQGTYGDLQHLWFDYSWSSWESLGGNGVSGDPAAVSWGPGRIDVFMTGWLDQVQHLWFDDWNWSSWESFPGSIYSAPAASSWGPGRLDVFGVGANNMLKRMTFDSNLWWGWAEVGNTAFSNPAAVSWGYGRVDVFMMGGANDIWHKWFQ